MFDLCSCCLIDLDFTLHFTKPRNKFIFCEKSSDCSIYKKIQYFKCSLCNLKCRNECKFPDKRKIDINKLYFLQLQRFPGNQILTHQKMVNRLTDKSISSGLLQMGIQQNLTELKDLYKLYF